jgi:cellulose synthase/poly-beta-1,6-N-acetylglucosamine synthase-like glycosyltransferase
MPGLSLPASTARFYDCPVLRRALFWGSLGALAWTHVGYPITAALLARVRARPARKGELEPTVTLVVAAHDEERVIERRLENLLALDYPPEKVEIVVVSDGSTDRTDELVESVAAHEPRVRLLAVARGGKTAAQNAAVRATGCEILAFSDANTSWRIDALRKLVRSFADPEVAYVAGAHYYERPEGTNREGVYTAFENWLRRTESRFGSITAGVGPIYAVRRDDYIELEDLRIGHDLALPYLLVQRGLRAIVDPEALSWEKPARDIADEYGRKLRMFEHCWLILLHGRMLRGLDRVYLLQVVSHRHLRYASGLLHLALLGSSLALARSGRVYRAALAAQAALLADALARSGIARYYVAVTWATVPALVTCLRGKVSPVWEKAAGTR